MLGGQVVVSTTNPKPQWTTVICWIFDLNQYFFQPNHHRQYFASPVAGTENDAE